MSVIPKTYPKMKSTTSVSLRYGLIIAAALIAYFLILRLFGLHMNPWFRMFNGVIMAVGLYKSIRFFKDQNESFNYTNGFVTGLLSGFLATIVFTVFMGIYLFHLDVDFMDHLLKNWVHKTNYGGGILIFIILVEGLSSTTVLTLMFMQLLKKSNKISQKA